MEIFYGHRFDVNASCGRLVIDQLGARRAVAITRHEKPRAVLLSIAEYEALTRPEPEYMAGLMENYRGMLYRMQGPDQRAAADKFFRASPEELGAAAACAAQQAKETQASARLEVQEGRIAVNGDSGRAAACRIWFTAPVTSTATPSLAQSWVNPLPARLHKPAFGIFVLWVAADSIRLWLGERWPEGWEFLGPGVWFAAALTLAVGLARRLPAQNVVAVAALAGLIGFAIEALNVATQIPFGHRAYQGVLGSRALGVAWYLPFVWVALAISGRGVARLILRPWRKLQYYGLWVMAAAIVLTLLMALNYEAAGSRLDWWWRENRPGVWSWYGSPAVSLLGWGITTLLIYGFTTPWFLNKQPVKQPTDWHPLIVWEVLMLWLILISGVHGAWPAVAVGAFSGLFAAGLAIRGGTW